MLNNFMKICKNPGEVKGSLKSLGCVLQKFFIDKYF